MNAQTIDARQTLEAVQRLPTEAQRAVLAMLRGVVVISDLYSRDETATPQAQRPGA